MMIDIPTAVMPLPTMPTSSAMVTKTVLAITLQATYPMVVQQFTVIQPVATSLDARMLMVTDGQT